MTIGIVVALLLAAPGWLSLASPVPELADRRVSSLGAGGGFLFVASDRGLERFDLQTREVRLLTKERTEAWIAVDVERRQLYCVGPWAPQFGFAVDFDGHRLNFDPSDEGAAPEVVRNFLERWGRAQALLGSLMSAVAWDANGEFYCPAKGRCLLRSTPRDTLRRTDAETEGPVCCAAAAPRYFFVGEITGLTVVRRANRRSTFFPDGKGRFERIDAMAVARDKLFLGVSWASAGSNETHGVYTIPLKVFERGAHSKGKSEPTVQGH